MVGGHGTFLAGVTVSRQTRRVVAWVPGGLNIVENNDANTETTAHRLHSD